MIGSLEIAQAQVLAARASSGAPQAGVDADAMHDETEPGVAGDATREEEMS
ncbi:hypothetical protein JOF42_003368 [Microbacterium phyllosphaerae]|uniref:Uncharacterized protein n=1 Tax=Microbacterium phyllosphaerae TaxID=124798 RepID=A0ABS4WUJ0_9MICO|nr:hypothetical protein [Microbacterium phyllosphaerae]MBP2379873.1 hypothetical protein [Microbacterium phyllosphaerae]